MNDQLQQKVLDNLVSLYQSKGLSTERMFQNPMFKQLPIDQKIQIVKRFGQQNTVKGNGTYWDKEDAKKLLLGLGMGALAVAAISHGKGTWNAIEAAKAAGGHPDVVGSMLMPVLTAVGIAGGAATEFNSLHDNYQNKKNLYHLNTNDDNAIINYLART